jgi:hypothetical protein
MPNTDLKKNEVRTRLLACLEEATDCGLLDDIAADCRGADTVNDFCDIVNAVKEKDIKSRLKNGLKDNDVFVYFVCPKCGGKEGYPPLDIVDLDGNIVCSKCQTPDECDDVKMVYDHISCRSHDHLVELYRFVNNVVDFTINPHIDPEIVRYLEKE